MISLVCYECPPLDLERCRFQHLGFEKRGNCEQMELGLYGVIERHAKHIKQKWINDDR